MKLSKPEEIDEEPAVDSDGPEPVGKEPTVDVEFMPEEAPVSEAVELHSEVLAQPESFGIAGFSTVQELQDRVGELEEVVEHLEELLDLVSVVSDVAVTAECDVCGGELEAKRPALGSSMIVCSECGDGKAGLE